MSRCDMPVHCSTEYCTGRYYESKYKACRAAFLIISRQQRQEERFAGKREQRIRQWVGDALTTDGAHHKQFFLQKIAIEIGIDINILVLSEPGVAP